VQLSSSSQELLLTYLEETGLALVRQIVNQHIHFESAPFAAEATPPASR
jgi:hypothetical protein